MPTNRQTYPIKFSGGLITNMSPLQQGMEMPGSARILRNFEPSIEGGYKRILGYDKYDLDVIPPYGIPVSYTHLRAHETDSYLVCRLLLEKKK